MKKYTFIVMLIFSLIACGTSPNVKSDNAKLIMEAQASPTKNEDARFAYNKGTKLLEENRLKEAEKYLLEAIRLDPLFIDAIDHLGIVYRRQQRPEEAIKMYLKSIDINAYNSVPYINLGLIYMNQNLYEKSIEYYSKVIEFEPENSESYYGLGELYQNIGEYEKSKIYFHESINKYLSKKSAYVYDAYFHQGINYYELKEYEEALKYFENAQAMYKNNQYLLQKIK